MSYIVLLSSGVCFENGIITDEFKDLYQLSLQNEISLAIISRNSHKTMYTHKIIEAFGPDNKISIVDRQICSRGNTLGDDDKNRILIVGAIKEDIWIAANNQILLVNPLWIDKVDTSILKYGFSISSPKQLVECISILKLDTQIYQRQKLSDVTEIISITRARNFRATLEQNAVINDYREYLKRGADKYRYAVFFHYLSMLFKSNEFRDIDYWTGAPSSTGATNNGIYEIVDYSRYLMKKREAALIVRHKPAEKSTEIRSNIRKTLDSSRHFSTMHVNPNFRNSIAGKKIVVLDDYVTNGHTFEATRLLLEAAGAAKIYLISIGTYENPYQLQEVNFNGDIFNPNYKFEIINKKDLHFFYNNEALDIIDEIYEIIYNRI